MGISDNIFGSSNTPIPYDDMDMDPSLKHEDYPVLADEKEADFREVITVDFTEMDGAAELIAAMREAGASLAIASSGPPEHLNIVLNMPPRGEQFKAKTNGNELVRGNPNTPSYKRQVLIKYLR